MNKYNLKSALGFGFILACIFGVIAKAENANIKMNNIHNSCQYSKGDEFVKGLIGLKKIPINFMAKNITIIERNLPQINQKNSVILSRKKIAAKNYNFPVSIWDNFWIIRQNSKKIKYAKIEINQSSNNHIMLAVQELQNAPSEADDGGGIAGINYEKPYKNILFIPKDNCWQIIEETRFK